MPCRATRDPKSGFLVSESFGPEVWLPGEISGALLDAFHSSVRKHRDLTLGHQAGALARAPGDRIRSPQALSAWHVTLEQVDGYVGVSMSAALRRTDPDLLDKPPENHWDSVGDPARITVSLRVDPATRVACFGAHTGLEGEPPPEEYQRVLAARRARRPYPPLPAAGHALSLETAPVGVRRGLASVRAGGLTLSQSGWINLFESHGRPTLALSPDFPGPKAPSGFLTHGDFGWPRLWFEGINLDVIADVMGPSPSVSMTISGENGSYVQFAGFETPSDPIVETHLRAEIAEDGLTLSCRCKSLDRKTQRPTWREATLTLSWELLILRYPRFLRFRDQVHPTRQAKAPRPSTLHKVCAALSGLFIR